MNEWTNELVVSERTNEVANELAKVQVYKRKSERKDVSIWTRAHDQPSFRHIKPLQLQLISMRDIFKNEQLHLHVFEVKM